MKVEIRKMKDSDVSKVCYLDRAAHKALKLSKRPYRLHIGKLSISCVIMPEDNEQEEMKFPNVLFKQLLLQDKSNLNIWRSGTDIYLGPVLGLLVPERVYKAISSGRVEVDTMEHIKKAGPRSGCLSYCFCSDNIDLEQRRIKGLTFSSRYKEFRECYFPIPNVIYDRTSYFSSEQNSLISIDSNVIQLRQRFNVHFINNRRNISDYDLQKYLSKELDINMNLPQTIIYKKYDDVVDMLDKYNYVFLKTIDNPLTEDIAIRKDADKCKMDIYKKDFNISFFDKPDNVQSIIEKLIDDKRLRGCTKVMLQQGITPIKLNNRNISFKALLIKDQTGNWRIINIFSEFYTPDKDGGAKRTKNIGVYEEIYTELSQIYDRNIPSKEQLEYFAEKSASAIEKRFGTLGEMELSIILDEQGKPYLLKCNLAPDKKQFLQFSDDLDYLPHADAIFQYTKYLSRYIELNR